MLRGECAVRTSGRIEMIDLTDRLQGAVSAAGIRQGMMVAYNPHTTSALTINEGADPDVQRDLLGALGRIVPADYPYRHAEGNSPAHMMAMLVGASVTILVEGGRLRLGTWQRVFLCEFDGPRDRKVWWSILPG